VPQGHSRPANPQNVCVVRREKCFAMCSSKCNAVKQQPLSPHHLGGGSSAGPSVSGRAKAGQRHKRANTRPPTRGTVLPCGTCALKAELVLSATAAACPACSALAALSRSCRCCVAPKQPPAAFTNAGSAEDSHQLLLRCSRSRTCGAVAAFTPSA
jgi:hypothetical protein